jgi:hypothetical protein
LLTLSHTAKKSAESAWNRSNSIRINVAAPSSTSVVTGSGALVVVPTLSKTSPALKITAGNTCPVPCHRVTELAGMFTSNGSFVPPAVGMMEMRSRATVDTVSRRALHQNTTLRTWLYRVGATGMTAPWLFAGINVVA